MRTAHRRFLPIAIAFLVLVQGASCARAEKKVLYDAKSQYNRIIVEEDDMGVRRLYFEPDGAVQTALDPNDPLRLILPYAKTTMSGLALVGQPRRMLIVGLGGGAMPRFLHALFPDAQIDIAELDPAVADVARKFFGLREDDRMKIHIGDGRKFIETTENRYDIIFLDAFSSDDIPYALTTKEFLTVVRSKLSNGGIVVANVWGSLDNALYPSMLKTYRDVFEELHIVRAPRSENRILLVLPKKAGLSADDLTKKAAQTQTKLKLNFDLRVIVFLGYEPLQDLPEDAKVLLDADKPQ